MRILGRLVWLRIAVGMVASLLAGCALADAAPQWPAVLVLNSFQRGLPVPDGVEDAIVKSLREIGYPISSLYIEQLDLLRDARPEHLDDLARALRLRYGSVPIGAVVVVGPQALQFLQLHLHDMFSQALLVTTLIAGPAPTVEAGRKLIHFPWLEDVVDTLRAALVLRPRAQRVLVVSGANDAMLSFLAQARPALQQFGKTLEFEYTDRLSFDEMLARVRTFPAEGIILYSSFFGDVGGKVYAPIEVLGPVSQAAAAPVFSMQEVFLGHGTAGGYLLRTESLGAMVGQSLRDWLKGRQQLAPTVTTVPVPSVPMFDAQALQRWNLEAGHLPAHSVVINQRQTIWSQYRLYVVLSAVVFATMVLLLLTLLLQTNRRRQTEAELRESEERFRVLVEHAPEAIMVYDLDLGHFIDANRNAERLLGCSRERLLQIGPEDFVVTPAHLREQIERAMVENNIKALAGLPVLSVREVRSFDGRDLVCEIRLVNLPSAQRRLLRASLTDITERRKSEAQIEKLAYFDPLTGQANRRLLHDRLSRAVATAHRAGTYAALLYLDLDNFKALNDTQGHNKGDQLLIQVSERLQSCVRETDTLSRLGGDEFVVLIEGLGSDEKEANRRALNVGEKILHSLAQPYELEGKALHSTASIGVVVFGSEGEAIDELLRRSDLAMYHAKAAGRNTLRFFNQDMHQAVIDRAELESDLRLALRDQQFRMFLQAQVDRDGCPTGAEALLRWQHPQRGLVPPNQFIPVAEDMGMIVELGDWVLETACRQLVAWAREPHLAGLTIAVNVSVRQFRQPDFVERTLAVVQRIGAPPQRLKLELTESLLVADIASTVQKMHALKLHGLGFSLDDFGTGYSSLSYLQQLPLDQLKIDQSFVRGVLDHPNDAAIARTIIALGASLGLAVIAEGVETQGQREFLQAHGCQACQGYLFCKPVDQVAFADYLAAHPPAELVAL